MFTIAANLAVTLFLGINAVTDLRTRTVRPLFSALALAAGLLAALLAPGISFADRLWGLLPGGSLALVSIFLPDEIGKGDGCVLAACGAWLGIRGTLELALLGFILAGAASVWLLLRKKADRKTQLPFIPFLFAGQILRLWL